VSNTKSTSAMRVWANPNPSYNNVAVSLYIKISAIRDYQLTPRYTLTSEGHVTPNKNLTSQNLDIVLEYHNSPSVFW